MTQSDRGSGETAGERLGFGRVLAALRTAHGWTQAELAAASGVDKAQISRYERAVDQPSFRTQKALLEALRVSPGDLDALHRLLDRIVTGGDRAESPSPLTRPDLSALAELLGFGGASSPGGAADGRATAPASDAEVERLAREAGQAAARFVRLHFARLTPRDG